MEFTVRQFSSYEKIVIGTLKHFLFVNTKDQARKTNTYKYTVIVSSTLKPRLVVSNSKVMKTNLEEGQV